MEKCRLCGGADFYKEAGYFFCHICQTQKEDIREEILDIRVDLSTRLRKTRIRRPKSGETSKDLGWTSWELYNFVLIGLTDEIIELGAPSDIKLTVLQLWATYLGRIEIAFTSTKKKSVPKLAKRYNERDAEIIYGKLQSKTRSRKRRRIRSSTGTSMTCSYQSEGTSSLRELNKTKKLLINADYDRYMQSQASSEGDGISSFSQSAYSTQSSTDNYSNKEIRLQFSTHAKKEINKIKNISKSLQKDERVQYRQKHITTQYKIGPHIITPMRLWAIIYLALRIHNHSIHLGDMMRYGREGHLSYYKLDHLVPSEIKLTRSDIKFLSQNKEITHKGMRRIIASMARFLGVHDIICSDFLPLVNRYCQELALPRGISLYAERLIALSPPKMAFDIRMPYAPNYEGRAMAFIIVVLKTLFGLDGMTEHQICKVAEKINSIASEDDIYDAKLFSFQDWQKYIECRKTILVNYHFPTKLKYNPDIPDTRNLYIKFLEYIHSKGEREEPEKIKDKHLMPWDLANTMKKCIYNLSEDDPPLQEMDIFPASLTPLSSYLQWLLDNPLHDLPSIVRTDFFSTKVGYMTKPDFLLQLALHCNLQLDIIESNLHFVEKIVPYFEQTRISSVNDLKRDSTCDPRVPLHGGVDAPCCHCSPLE
ncbi:hypothetical protein KM043_007150 [Ampulex compressa]|nr:hypothetical protein KM043_007150 [Ampulex compressa]